MAKDWLAKPLQDVKHEDSANKCPDCGCEELEYEHGEHYCRKCGTVIE